MSGKSHATNSSGGKNLAPYLSVGELINFIIFFQSYIFFKQPRSEALTVLRYFLPFVIN
jgi:hypothetical protein